MKRGRIYLGFRINRGGTEVFRTLVREPTFEDFGGAFVALIGPFRTKRAARFMAKHGAHTGNPHCVTVADAERISRQIAEKRT
jgi:hypothetical protein